MKPSVPLDADRDRLLDHIESPYHKGHLEQSTCAGTERNPLCGDQIQLQLLIERGVIQQAWFDGRGCAISQAAASMVCELLEDRTVTAARKVTAEEVLTLLGVPISPVRRRCALLVFQALTGLLSAVELG